MTTLYDVAKWFEHSGLVGETELALVMTIVAISKKPMGFGLIAPAGSGKTAALNLLLGDENNKIKSLIYSDRVYFKDAGSDTSFYYDAAKVNAKDIIYFRELQKDSNGNTIEAIKSLTEGKSANRKVVDVTKRDDGPINQEVKPKTVMFSLAIENDYKVDAELLRRCITMCNDISKGQTDKVLAKKSQLRWDKHALNIMTETQAEDVRKTVNSIMKYNFNIVNPFAPSFAKVIAKIAPDQKVRSMAEHFWDVMEGVTKLNCLERVAVNENTKLCNIQDLAQTLDIYKSSFVRDVHSIPPIGDVVLKAFSEADSVSASVKPNDLTQFGAAMYGRWYDVNHIRKVIQEKQKIVIAKNIVLVICRQLVDAGYLEDMKDGTTIKFQKTAEFSEFDTPNWNELLEEAATLVKEKYPDRYSIWLESQRKTYRHPITGEEVKLIK